MSGLKMNGWRKLAVGCLVAAGVWAALGLFSSAVNWKGGIVFLLAAVALRVRGSESWRGYAFTVWVFVSVAWAFVYPQAFGSWGGFKLSGLIVPLIQIIMFGMGTTLSPADFTRILKMPWPVFIGAILQFSIMPAVAFLVAKACGFDGELAAGVVLIGSVSGGVASNVMAYVARANVALSVTMTCVSTLLAPLVTPWLMRVFAGTFVPIDAKAMMVSILNMTLLPVLVGLLAHFVLYGRRPWARKISGLLAIAGGAFTLTILAIFLKADAWGACAPVRGGVMLSSALIGLVALAKLVVDILLGHSGDWMDKVLSLVSMSGICLILAVIIGQTYEVLIQAGFLLLVAAIIHNSIGYTLGYWLAKSVGRGLGVVGFRLGLCKTPESVISEADCRTVSIEVGMQNGGMATGLAIDVLHSHVAALPPNVFGAWMNVSGSILANWWKRNDSKEMTEPVREENSVGVRVE